MKKLLVCLMACLWLSLGMNANTWRLNYKDGQAGWSWKQQDMQPVDGVWQCTVNVKDFNLQVQEMNGQQVVNTYTTNQTTVGTALPLVGCDGDGQYWNIDKTDYKVTVNPDTKTVKFETAGQPAPATYELHGQITGNSNWESTPMQDNGDGSWSLTRDFVTGAFGIKKVQDNQQTGWYGWSALTTPADNCENADSNIRLATAGNYTVTFNTATQSISVKANGTVVTPTVPTLYVTGKNVQGATDEWNPEHPLEVTLGDDGYVFNAAGEFKISTAKGPWDTFNGGNITLDGDWNKGKASLKKAQGGNIKASDDMLTFTVNADMTQISYPYNQQEDHYTYKIAGTFNSWNRVDMTSRDDKWVYELESLNCEFGLEEYNNGVKTSWLWCADADNYNIAPGQTSDVARESAGGHNWKIEHEGRGYIILDPTAMTLAVVGADDLATYDLYGNFLTGSEDEDNAVSLDKQQDGTWTAKGIVVKPDTHLVVRRLDDKGNVTDTYRVTYAEYEGYNKDFLYIGAVSTRGIYPARPVIADNDKASHSRVTLDGKFDFTFDPARTDGDIQGALTVEDYNEYFEEEALTIYFDTNGVGDNPCGHATAWTSVNCYAWDITMGAYQNAPFPGQQMQPVEGKEGVYMIRLARKYDGIIFSAGGNGQSRDIANPVNGYIYDHCGNNRPYAESREVFDGQPATLHVSTDIFHYLTLNALDNGTHHIAGRVAVETSAAGNEKFKIYFEVPAGQTVHVTHVVDSERHLAPALYADATRWASRTDGTYVEVPAGTGTITYVDQDANGVQGPQRTATYDVNPVITGVEDITVDDGTCTWYTLQGVPADASALTPGIYICRRGNTNSKVTVR